MAATDGSGDKGVDQHSSLPATLDGPVHSDGRRRTLGLRSGEGAAVDPIPPEARDAVLESLLTRHPDAPVAAISDDGLFVPMPDAPRLAGRAILPGRSGLDLVVPSDHVAVIEGWSQARATGASRVAVRLVEADGEQAEIHYVDMTHRFGVYIGILTVVGDGRRALSHLQRVVTVIPKVCRVVKDKLAVVVSLDAATTLILGWTEEDLVGHRTLAIIHPDDQKAAIENWMEMLGAPGSSMRWRGRHQCRDGSWRWMDTTNHNQLDADGGGGVVVAEMVDVSDEMAAHDALREREQLLHRLAEALPLGVFELDTERRVLYMNTRLAEMSGSAEMAHFDAIVASAVPEDRDLLLGCVSAAVDGGNDCDVEIRMRCPGSGETRLWAINLRALTGELGQMVGAVGCAADVTESARLRSALEYKATFDELTSCHNRASVMAALDAAITRDADRGTGTGVIFLDLDHFKSINDDLGHTCGDRLLQVVAERLRGSVRDGDLVGRLGGDEFVVIGPNMGDRRALRALAQRLSVRLHGPVNLDGTVVQPHASLGLAFSAGRRCSAETLISEADDAMYAAKRRSIAAPEHDDDRHAQLHVLSPPATPSAPAR